MRVLFISGAQGADFQCDMILHGLRSLLGPDCVDAKKLDIMYQGGPLIGFWSVYGNLPNIDIDRTDIPAKIASRYFDAIVYGSVHRCRDYLDEVRAAYPPSRVAFIDGEDDHGIAPVFGLGVYFKRELVDEPFLPIQFCIPKEKIREADMPKERLMSPMDPRDRSTYVCYGSEAQYYNQYSISRFGRTMKKGGWDCSRHYEIMASGCLPYFHDLESCPPRTMFLLPRLALLEARSLCDTWDDSSEARVKWDDLMRQVRSSLLADLTTEAMARYVLEQLQ